MLAAKPGGASLDCRALMRSRASMTALLGILCICLVALAGCGDDDGGAASPLDNVLGYLPEGAPLALAIDTDLDGKQYQRIEDIVDKFPFGDAVVKSLRKSIEEESGDFDQIGPLLGNEFVVGTSNPDAIVSDSSDDDFVGVIQTKSADKLEDALKREKAKPTGEKNGATIYKDDDGDLFAIEDKVLVVAGSRRQLDNALVQRDADNRLTEDKFNEAIDDLPEDSVARLYGDLGKLLASDPSTSDARKVKWVHALRTYGATVSFEDDVANVDFRVSTDSGELSDEDLPIASGSQSPPVLDGPGEIGAGVRDLTQIVDFAEQAGQAIDPAGFADYDRAKRTIEKQLDIDIENDLLKQLEGDTAVTYSLNGKYGIRAAVKSPKAFDRTLAKLGRVLPDVAKALVGESVGYAKPKRGGDFYALATADGGSVVYGVVDGVFVLANDAKIAGNLSKAKPKGVPGATGSIAVSSDGERLGRQLLRMLEPGLGGELAGALATKPLGALTGSVSAETDGLTGHFELAFD